MLTSIAGELGFDDRTQRDVNPYSIHSMWGTLWFLLPFALILEQKDHPLKRKDRQALGWCITAHNSSITQRISLFQKSQKMNKSSAKPGRQHEPQLWFLESPLSNCSCRAEHRSRSTWVPEYTAQRLYSILHLPLKDLQRLALKE